LHSENEIVINIFFLKCILHFVFTQTFMTVGLHLVVIFLFPKLRLEKTNSSQGRGDAGDFAGRGPTPGADPKFS
jgi:hypothetical protein